MSERTCVLVKPDGVGLKRVGSVVDRFERAGLSLRGLKMIRLSRTDAEAFYKEHQGKGFFEGLLAFMTAAPIVAMVWEGDKAITTVRSLMGATNSQAADSGTLRRDFGTDNRYNLVHGSDSPASAEREIQFFFKTGELFAYAAEDWKK
jgi:nucleoside-diphosphate kinase